MACENSATKTPPDPRFGGAGESNATPVQYGMQLPQEWDPEGGADIRLAWIVRAGDCLVCGQQIGSLRDAERADSGSTLVFLIGTVDDTLNLRTFLWARRTPSPIRLVDPARLSSDWQSVLTPELIVVNTASVLWAMGRSTADPLVVLRRIRETEYARDAEPSDTTFTGLPLSDG